MFVIVAFLALMYSAVMLWIGLPWLAIIPALCCFLFFAYSLKTQASRLKKFLFQYALLFAWMLVWAWWGLVLYELQFSLLSIGLILVAINALALILSFVYDYKDGQTFFHIALYLVACVWVVAARKLSLTEPYLLGMTFFLFVLYAWLSYAGRRFFFVSQMIYSLTYFTFHLIVLSVIYIVLQGNFLLIILFCQIYLFGVYLVSYFLRRDYQTEQKRDLTLEAILSGRRLVRQKREISLSPFIQRAKQEVGQILPFVQYLLNSLTVLVVGILLISFVVQVLDQSLSIWDHIVYRLSIGVYIANFFVLQRDKTMYDVHRFLFFAVVNVAFLLSLFLLSDFVIIWIVVWGVLWTVTQSIVMLVQQTNDFLQSRDYYYRSLVVVCVIILVLRFMIDIEISHQLIFAGFLLYSGVQVLLLRYVFQRLMLTKRLGW